MAAVGLGGLKQDMLVGVSLFSRTHRFHICADYAMSEDNMQDDQSSWAGCCKLVRTTPTSAR